MHEHSRKFNLTLDVMGQDSIAFVKGQIQAAWDLVSIRRDRLTWRPSDDVPEIDLQDANTLAFYGIEDGDVIILRPALGGGGKRARTLGAANNVKDDKMAEVLEEFRSKKLMLTTVAPSEFVQAACERIALLEEKVETMGPEVITYVLEQLSIVELKKLAEATNNKNQDYKILFLSKLAFGVDMQRITKCLNDMKVLEATIHATTSMAFYSQYLGEAGLDAKTFASDVLTMLLDKTREAGKSAGKKVGGIALTADVEM